jgi:arsenite oxidase small subunit
MFFGGKGNLVPPVPEDEADKEPEASRHAHEEAGDAATNSRREFLRLALAAAVVLVTVGVASVARSLISPPALPPEETGTVTTTSTQTGSNASPFPRVMVANVNDIAEGKSITFNYPLEETPNILAKLGQKAQGGVGPEGDIVAFSQICEHLGCIYGYVPQGKSPACDKSYTASGPVGYCCCHGSVFDLANAGKVIGGPSPRPVPQVVLEFESTSGNVYAIGMLPPAIFGHNTGSDNVLDDLQGGTLVS